MAKPSLRMQFLSDGHYFMKKDQERIKELREKTQKEFSGTDSEEHKYHCFRCGTKSLVEIEKDKVKVDICVNKGCGAVHLDPGELEDLLDNKEFITKARASIFDIFK